MNPIPFESPSDFDRGYTRATPADLLAVPTLTRCESCTGLGFDLCGTCYRCNGTGNVRS